MGSTFPYQGVNLDLSGYNGVFVTARTTTSSSYIAGTYIPKDAKGYNILDLGNSSGTRFIRTCMVTNENVHFAASFVVLPNVNYEGMAIVESFPEGDLYEYRYIDGEFIHDPLPVEEVVETPSQLDLIEAQVTYTAMMTDTLLEV